MLEFKPENRSGRRLLLTPGPLSTSPSVKAAMQIDIGSWDVDCIELVREIRSGLLELLGEAAGERTCVLLQGSGSYGVEAALGSAVPREGKLLILKNGAYGQRMMLTCRALGLAHAVLEDPENRPHEPARLEAALAADRAITHVAVVHCETTTGVLNPLRELGLAVARQRRRFIVDAISSFGAYPMGPGRDIDFGAGPIDHLVGSANKCLEGAPGFTFILSRTDAVKECEGRARSLCLDLHGQWSTLEKTGQFRFTPPTHVLLAFRQALRELAAEGGVEARARRYHESHAALVCGMERLGFEPYVAPEHRSWIITAFLTPSPSFDFRRFYDLLHRRGYIIYPGKLSSVSTFRIANIGRIDRGDIEGLLAAVAEVKAEMGGW
jgi:2-aminoethylphosphonate-pyruvate transaminase